MQILKQIKNIARIAATSATVCILSGCLNSENFDTTTAPALPFGWTTSGSGGELWQTVSDSTPDRPSDTAPNSAFVKSANSQDASLFSPIITLHSGGFSQVFLKHRCKTENGWDGAVLEMSVDGSSFSNITNFGTFVEGPYSPLASLPFGVSSAWTGENSYVTSRINLGLLADGTTLKFKFRLVSDSSVVGTGCSVDSVALNGADLVVSKTDSQDPVIPGVNLSYTVTVLNNGPLDATGVVLSDTLPPGFEFISSTLSQGSFSLATPPVLRANIGTLAVGASATMTINGKAPNFVPNAPGVQVDSPSNLARTIMAGAATFGPALASTGPSGPVILAADGVGDSEDGCQALPAGSAEGSILLMRQSNTCSFNQQVSNAEASGAIGAIIYSLNSSEALVNMGSSDIPVTIPSVFIGATDGRYLKTSIASAVSVTLRSFASSSLNEARALGSQVDFNLNNNFASEFTLIVPDSDGDGVIDTADGCPSDNGKTAPGACGCGIADLDSNLNGVFDCLATAEFKAQAQTLSTALSALKILGANASKKQRAAQSKAKSKLKAALKSVSNFINSTGVNVSLLDNSTPLTKFNSQIKAAVNATLKLQSSTFAKDKKKAGKLIGKLLSVIG